MLRNEMKSTRGELFSSTSTSFFRVQGEEEGSFFRLARAPRSASSSATLFLILPTLSNHPQGATPGFLCSFSPASIESPQGATLFLWNYSLSLSIESPAGCNLPFSHASIESPQGATLFLWNSLYIESPAENSLLSCLGTR
jgi:hypothetical protein